LIEIISLPLRQISRVVIHRIEDPSVPFKYLGSGESE
jgi:hypothetical protein